MSRRTALRTSVALGAAGLGLVTGKADASRADAELLALGEKIDPLFAKIKAAQVRAWEGRDRIENVLDMRRLAPDGTERWPSYDRGWWTKAEVEQSLSVEGEIERADAEFQKAEADLEILGKEEEALAQALFRTKATTIEGVAVKARAAAYLQPRSASSIYEYAP